MVIVEIGGTVGDIEILPFIEAIRQFRRDVGRDNVCYVHLTLVPYLGPSGEQKTKPTQHSVTELRSRGIQPDVIVCRSDRMISEDLKRKISLLCDVPIEAVVSAVDADNIYQIPLVLHEEGLDRYILRLLRFDEAEHPIDLTGWEHLVDQVDAAVRPVRIGIIGKYVDLPDAYLSVVESLRHAGFHHGAKVEIEWIQAATVPDLLERDGLRRLRRHGHPRRLRRAGSRGQDRRRPLRPGARPAPARPLPRPAGHDHRGGPLAGRAWRRPTPASSTPAPPHPVIDLMDDQHDVVDKGGTMRLGSYVPSWCPARRWPRPTATRWCPSATATATRSTPATARGWRRPGWSARASRPTAGWSSSSSCPATRSGWAPRPIPSSRAGPTGPTRSSASWSAPPWPGPKAGIPA